MRPSTERSTPATSLPLTRPRPRFPPLFQDGEEVFIVYMVDVASASKALPEAVLTA
jgi:hypothetical protein